MLIRAGVTGLLIIEPWHSNFLWIYWIIPGLTLFISLLILFLAWRYRPPISPLLRKREALVSCFSRFSPPFGGWRSPEGKHEIWFIDGYMIAFHHNIGSQILKLFGIEKGTTRIILKIKDPIPSNNFNEAWDYLKKISVPKKPKYEKHPWGEYLKIPKEGFQWEERFLEGVVLEVPLPTGSISEFSITLMNTDVDKCFWKTKSIVEHLLRRLEEI